MSSNSGTTRNLLLMGGGVAAAAIAIYFVGARNKVEPGAVVGTIAAADRYQEAQVGAEDIGLGDKAVSDFIQTETFEQLVKDKDFRALAADPGFSALAQHAGALP